MWLSGSCICLPSEAQLPQCSLPAYHIAPASAGCGLATALRPFARGASRCVWILGLMDFGHLLAPMEPVEVRFDQRLGAIQRRVRRSEAQIRPDTWNADRERHQEILAGALPEARGNQITTSATSMTVTLAREY